MKRFHVHVQVEDLEQSTRFYTTLFGAPPSVSKADYAKWMLDDPRLNFAISPSGGASGVNHLGFELDSDEALQDMRAQVAAADQGLREQRQTSCCYARSNKYWAKDPSGIAWEVFHTLEDAPLLAEERATAPAPTPGHEGGDVAPAACCVSNERTASACC